jgi:glycerol-3-phosphate dehydrogenase (NAD(P)+)
MQQDLVGVVGAGAWAQMIAQLLRANKRPVALWPGAGVPPAALADAQRTLAAPGVTVHAAPSALTEARLIFLAMPAWQLRASTIALADHLRGYHRLIHTARGLEGSTLLRASELLRAETPVRQLGALVGPLHPDLHAAGLPGVCVVGSAFPELIKDAQSALGAPGFRVYGNLDIAGVEIASASARLASVAVGFVDTLQLGPGARGALITRAAAEMARLGAAIDARPTTFTGLAGLGYMIAQASEPVGVDVRIGRALAEGQGAEAIQTTFGPDAVELFQAASVIAHLAQGRRVEAHIIPAVEAVLAGALTPPEAAHRLLTLSQMME